MWVHEWVSWWVNEWRVSLQFSDLVSEWDRVGGLVGMGGWVNERMSWWWVWINVLSKWADGIEWASIVMSLQSAIEAGLNYV